MDGFFSKIALIVYFLDDVCGYLIFLVLDNSSVKIAYYIISDVLINMKSRNLLVELQFQFIWNYI